LQVTRTNFCDVQIRPVPIAYVVVRYT